MLIDRLVPILAELNDTSSDIEASALISIDGLAMASMLHVGLDEDRIAAMSAAVLSVGGRTAHDLARGNLELVLVKGGRGYVLMIDVGKEGVLTVLARSRAELDLIFPHVKRAAENIAQLL